jgi:hypothetical protein
MLGGGGPAAAVMITTPPPPPCVHLLPQVPGVVRVRPIVFGDRPKFNYIRVQMIRAAARYMETQSVEDQRLLQINGWLSTTITDQIVFDRLPVAHDTSVMSVLIRSGLVGVYWFVNHSDTRGLLSCGQVYDMLVSLDRLSGYGLDGQLWPPRLYDDLVSFLQACLDNSSGVVFDLVVDEPTPPAAPAGGIKITPNNIGSVLASIKPLTDAAAAAAADKTTHEPYNPAKPFYS